jgi:hypothetical protein
MQHKSVTPRIKIAATNKDKPVKMIEDLVKVVLIVAGGNDNRYTTAGEDTIEVACCQHRARRLMGLSAAKISIEANDWLSGHS